MFNSSISRLFSHVLSIKGKHIHVFGEKVTADAEILLSTQYYGIYVLFITKFTYLSLFESCYSFVLSIGFLRVSTLGARSELTY
ncbi:hypothetical protein ACQFX9_21255 [Aliinostoc sp. HNIBRCY26]|uniref:hypothetical protein n=1 Tax=Aliinostoc sp. HNIBRCY26 TaxID=3418997 RepID=UPI003D018D1F